jgi:hypothetical protein
MEDGARNLAPEGRRLGMFAEAQRRFTFQLKVTLSQAAEQDKNG